MERGGARELLWDGGPVGGFPIIRAMTTAPRGIALRQKSWTSSVKAMSMDGPAVMAVASWRSLEPRVVSLQHSRQSRCITAN